MLYFVFIYFDRFWKRMIWMTLFYLNSYYLGNKMFFQNQQLCQILIDRIPYSDSSVSIAGLFGSVNVMANPFASSWVHREICWMKMERSTVVGVAAGTLKLMTRLTPFRATPRAKIWVATRTFVCPLSNDCNSDSRTLAGVSLEYQLTDIFEKCIFSQSMSDFFYENKQKNYVEQNLNLN